MNRSGSHPNHENLVNTGYWEGSPYQGLYGVLHSARIKHEKNHQVLRIGGIHHTRGYGGISPHQIVKRGFHGKARMIRNDDPPWASPEPKNAEAFFFSVGFEKPQYPVGRGGAYDASALPGEKSSVCYAQVIPPLCNRGASAAGRES